MCSNDELPLVFATGNQHKVNEFREICSDLPLKLAKLSEFPQVDSPEETGVTFCENALQKTMNVCKNLDLPSCADDSGLSVVTLDGIPGIHSARFAGPNATPDEKNKKLLQMLNGCCDRTAYFTCAAVIAVGEHHLSQWGAVRSPASLGWERHMATGYWIWRGETAVFGWITDKIRGDKGFGYDPIFYHPASDRTFAQMTMTEKNNVSHRGSAFHMMKRQLALLFEGSF